MQIRELQWKLLNTTCIVQGNLPEKESTLERLNTRGLTREKVALGCGSCLTAKCCPPFLERHNYT